MNKLILIIFFYIYNTFGSNNTDSFYTKEYTQLDFPIFNQYQIIEFFSFYCTYCYQFDEIYKIDLNIKKQLIEKDKFMKYHVDFLGSMGKELTIAWAIAIFFKIDEKISPILFQKVQNISNPITEMDILSIFASFGINKEKYELAKNSFSVKCFLKKQYDIEEKLNLKSIPTILVNNQFIINNDAIHANSIENYTKKYINIINHLLSNG
ncbi:MAG: DsbA family protein [Wigglesworthia glossinidia]|nr:DsbA family protein [Wigglesworthia glossinidia]